MSLDLFPKAGVLRADVQEFKARIRRAGAASEDLMSLREDCLSKMDALKGEIRRLEELKKSLPAEYRGRADILLRTMRQALAEWMELYKDKEIFPEDPNDTRFAGRTTLSGKNPAAFLLGILWTAAA